MVVSQKNQSPKKQSWLSQVHSPQRGRIRAHKPNLIHSHTADNISSDEIEVEISKDQQRFDQSYEKLHRMNEDNIWMKLNDEDLEQNENFDLDRPNNIEFRDKNNSTSSARVSAALKRRPHSAPSARGGGMSRSASANAAAHYSKEQVSINSLLMLSIIV